MIRPPRSAAFTLIEMITVISIIVILVSLVLAVNGLVQRKAAANRAAAEIQLLTQACEAYKTDNGGYPQDNSNTQSTNLLDPTVSTNPTTSYYSNACSFLYASLSGDTNANGVIDANEKGNTNYAPDFFKPSRMAGGPTTAVTNMYIMDPYGNSYGYSTAGLQAMQEYQAALSTTPSATLQTNGNGNPKNTLDGTCGYNTTFDLWSTAGTTSGSPSDLAKWVKNW